MDEISKKSFLKRFWWIGLVVVVILAGAWVVMTYVVHPKGGNSTTKQGGASDAQKLIDSNKNKTAAAAFDAANPPKFVQADFVELDKVYMISKFRSGDGHDFSSNSGETCRSMKHYFGSMDPSQPDYKVIGGGDKTQYPMPTIDKDVKIFSPVDGTMLTQNFDSVQFDQEIDVIPDAYPFLEFRIMHAQLAPEVKSGEKVKAGQTIGLVLANQSFDLGINYETGGKTVYLSYFSLLPDSVFAAYQARGVTSRDEMIITKEYRDAHPYECTGETFAQNYAWLDAASIKENLVFLSGYDAVNAAMNPKK